MNEQKVKVGQVWQNPNLDDVFEILCIHEGDAWVHYKDHNLTGEEMCGWIKDCCTLISDPDQPWLPLPDGYRLVTDEEMDKYDKPMDAYCTALGKRYWVPVTVANGRWQSCMKYAVPTDYSFETAQNSQNTPPTCEKISEIDSMWDCDPSPGRMVDKINELVEAVNILLKAEMEDR